MLVDAGLLQQKIQQLIRSKSGQNFFGFMELALASKPSKYPTP